MSAAKKKKKNKARKKQNPEEHTKTSANVQLPALQTLLVQADDEAVPEKCLNLANPYRSYPQSNHTICETSARSPVHRC